MHHSKTALPKIPCDLPNKRWVGVTNYILEELVPLLLFSIEQKRHGLENYWTDIEE